MLKTKEVSATSRLSFKIPQKGGDLFYTFEFGEVCEVAPNTTDEELEKDKQQLWQRVHKEIDTQVANTFNLYKNQSKPEEASKPQ